MHSKKIHEIPLQEVDHVDLRKVIQYLLDQRNIILAITLCIFSFGMLYAMFSPPKYQSSILLKIQRKLDVVGSDSTLSGDSTAVQIALIKSEFILKPVVQAMETNSHSTPETEFENIAKLNKNLFITDLSNSADNPANTVAILRLSLIGNHPAEITKTLNQIAVITQQQNIKLRAEAAGKSLIYLNKQIPIVKRELQSAETQLNNYQALSGKVNLKLQTDNLVNHLAEINAQIEKTRLKKMELLEQYTDKHPFVITINQSLHQLTENREAIIQQIRDLPDSQQKVDELTREVTVQNELYMTLLNKIHQLEVVKASTVSDIEVIADPNTAMLIPTLKLSVIAIISLMIGLVIGSLTALVLKIVKSAVPIEGKVLSVRPAATLSRAQG